MKSAASQSSNSGWLGHSPCEPKSLTVLTRPRAEDDRPQTIGLDPRHQRLIGRHEPLCQIEPGVPFAVDRLFRQRRQKVRRVGGNLLAVLVYWPRILMKVSRGFSISSITIVLGMVASKAAFCFFSSSSLALNDRVIRGDVIAIEL